MKIWLSFLFCLFAITAHGQPLRLPTNPATGKVVYGTMVIPPAGPTKAQIYEQAKRWMASTVGPLQEDAAARSVRGSGHVDVWDIRYQFTLRVDVTDTGTSYTISDITWHVMGSTPVETGTVEELRDSKRVGIGKGTRTKSLADMDKKIIRYTTGLSTAIFQLSQ